MKKLFLIIGAPGSGKTTDAQIIAQQNPLIAHFSTGDLLREEVQSGSENGKLINSFISKGNLCPLDIVVQTIVRAIKNSSKNTILIDGYPRSVEQMQALHEILQNEQDIELISVIEVKVSEKTAKDRVLGRGRSDDQESVFNNRLEVYTGPLGAIRSFYGPKLHVIDGERDIDSIVKDMSEFIKTKGLK
ncbi:MAG: adenylate kinase [Helicobacter sp.]|nr:adenylate kinase [Helicobacter sp.]